MNNILKKLTSRKFLAAAAGFVLGAALAAAGLDADVVVSCLGAGMSCASVVTYIISEGKIDAAAVQLARQAAGDIKEAGQAIKDSDVTGSILDGSGKMLAGHLDKGQLSEMTMDDLVHLATEMGLDAAGKNKTELVEMIAAEEVQYPAQ